MSLAVDIMHLVVIATGLGLGAWALIGLRTKLPLARFAVFGVASVGALFGCAALAGEVGLLPPAAWFGLVMAAMIAATAASRRVSRRPSSRVLTSTRS